VITKNGDGWVFRAERTALDVDRVKELYESAGHLAPDASAGVLREALSVWRGDPYADIEAHGELDAEITRLNELRLTVLEARVGADLELGRHRDLVGELDGLIAEHTYRERFRAQHMLALYRSGRQREALESYRQMRELLVDELGVDPSPELQDLERRILDHDETLEVTAEHRAAARPTDRELSNLPVPATQLVGRVAEIARVSDLMYDHRLVTLVGVGGCGKTRLGIEVGRQLMGEFDDGVYFVDLSAVSNDESVASKMADEVFLGIGPGSPIDRVSAYLDDKQALIVLDNCEHVVRGCADVAATLLEHPGTWRLLATSRESLGVEGEQLYGVPPLSAGTDAVELFEIRAGELDLGFAVDDANRRIVQDLCERLDGMPLAIELAAARTTVMSPAELLAGIDDRFRLLSGGRRRSGDRRRTLDATLDWSFDLLTTDERELFSSVGVFNGPFDAPSAAAVAGIDDATALDLLEALVAKSMVRPERDGGITRFRLLATVRAYAEVQLMRHGRLAAARDRHLAHMLERAPELDYGDWMAAMPNIDAGIGWAVTEERWTDAAELLLAGSTRWHELPIGTDELDRLDLIADRLPSHDPRREQLRMADVGFAIGAGLITRALTSARKALLSEDQAIRDGARMAIGNLLAMTDPDESLRQADAIEGNQADQTLYRESIRAYVHMYRQEYPEALRLLRPHGDAAVPFTIAAAAIHLMNDEPADALVLAGDRPVAQWNGGAFEVIAGLSELALGRRDRAEQRLLANARIAADGRIPYAANGSLVGIAALAHDDGDVQWATEIIHEAVLQRFQGMSAVARSVAARIGVREEFVERQEARYWEDSGDATPFLRQTLARWDARQSTDETG